MSSLDDVAVSRPRAGAIVVECTGEHDVTTSEEIGNLFAELVVGNDLIVIDLSEAEFIDSSFIHNLVKLDRLARLRGTRIRLQFGTAPIVARALELSGTLDRFEHATTRADALSHLDSGPGFGDLEGRDR